LYGNGLDEQRISDVQNVRLIEGQDSMLLDVFLAWRHRKKSTAFFGSKKKHGLKMIKTHEKNGDS
jgi:hypothetical protein